MSKADIILLIILAIVVLVIGGKKLPELARGVGQAGKELKKGFKDGSDEDKSDKDTTK